jgi:hypothetical protein
MPVIICVNMLGQDSRVAMAAGPLFVAAVALCQISALQKEFQSPHVHAN